MLLANAYGFLLLVMIQLRSSISHHHLLGSSLFHVKPCSSFDPILHSQDYSMTICWPLILPDSVNAFLAGSWKFFTAL